MSALAFKIAMGNTIHTGDYDPPELDPARRGQEWLIVRRWGTRGQYLEISDTTTPEADDPRAPATFTRPMPDEAPAQLDPKHSMLGLMLRSHGDEGAVFLLVRRNIDKQVVSGQFYPVDGYAELRRDGSGWRLRASGRHAHNDKDEDVPNPTTGGMSWHFDAISVIWKGQDS